MLMYVKVGEIDPDCL